jgi:hypothetical protein
MSTNACGECGAPHNNRGGLAIWANSFTSRVCCHLCADCWAGYKREGMAAIPTAYRQGHAEAVAARNKRKSGPLVPGTRRW